MGLFGSGLIPEFDQQASPAERTVVKCRPPAVQGRLLRHQCQAQTGTRLACRRSASEAFEDARAFLGRYSATVVVDGDRDGVR